MLNRRVMYQLIGIIVFAVMYVIGKNYLMAYDFTSVPSFYYPYSNIGIIMLLAACGFSYIAFTVIEKETNREPIHKLLFTLLQITSLAIVIEFYTIKVFHYPVVVQVVGILLVISLVIISSRNSRVGTST
ncbi:hypothetical protein DTX80_08665 [Bacilli bacterium]|nr:hypothetical protein WH51_10850 [Bacilli bacterium VT-13-104]PZD84630.1 hypothetical protein DEJ64_11680 [Bacilli bacterium]PZD89202.1 hypothetical protein DEJ60_05690 [Bacilli bacterium]PZD91775.1 hypothetical protein DEJ66_06115 [Bacilli bacterium]RCO05999.1 hypothetical protein DTX80_08665 [Bacilli bacterium]